MRASKQATHQAVCLFLDAPTTAAFCSVRLWKLLTLEIGLRLLDACSCAVQDLKLAAVYVVAAQVAI